MTTTTTISPQAAWRDFLHHFAGHLMQVGLPDEMTRPRVLVSSKNTVAWTEGNHVHCVELLRYRWPTREEPKGPRITRIALNAQGFRPSGSVLRGLGFPPGPGLSFSLGPRLEWSLLTHELFEFAAWLPAWIWGRHDPSFVIPPPPHPSHVWGGDLRRADYAWTVAAWEANESRPCRR